MGYQIRDIDNANWLYNLADRFGEHTLCTPWFPAHTKPVRVGLYLVDGPIRGLSILWAHWNGKSWCHSLDTSIELRLQSREWLGVNYDPSKI